MAERWKTVLITIAIGSGLLSFRWLLEKYWNLAKINRRKSLNSLPHLGTHPRSVSRRDLDALECEKWDSVGKVKKLWIYPVKSCCAVDVQESVIEKLGPKIENIRDRSLLIIEENGVMVTGRKINSTVLIKPVCDWKNNVVTLHYPSLQPLTIHLTVAEIEGKMIKFKVWDDDDVIGFDCGDEVAVWLKLALGRPCRLVYHGHIASTRSTVNHMDGNPLMNSDDNSLYADFTGVMLMSEESVQDLQQRCPSEIFVENFRPNILVEGCIPYDEDNWTYIKIGDAVFRNAKLCDRCTFPTIDFRTGQRNKNMEPIKTMKKYRMTAKYEHPVFGINLGVDKVGTVKVGDQVYALRD